MTTNIRMKYNVDGVYNTLHPETSTDQVLDTSTGKSLKDILTEVTGTPNKTILIPFSVVSTSEDQTTFSFDDPDFNIENDTVTVHINGEYMHPGEEYVVTKTDTTPSIILTTGIPSGQKVHIMVERNTYVATTPAVSSRLRTVECDTDSEIDLSDIDILRAYKLNELNNACKQAIYEGFESTATGHWFSFDEMEQISFNQQAVLIMLSGGVDSYTDIIKWRTKSGLVVQLAPKAFVQVLEEAKKHKMAQQEKYWELEVQLSLAVTVEEIQAITW